MSMFLENMSTFLRKEIVFSNFQIFEVLILRKENTHSQCVFFLAVFLLEVCLHLAVGLGTKIHTLIVYSFQKSLKI